MRLWRTTRRGTGTRLFLGASLLGTITLRARYRGFRWLPRRCTFVAPHVPWDVGGPSYLWSMNGDYYSDRHSTVSRGFHPPGQGRHYGAWCDRCRFDYWHGGYRCA